MLLSNGVKTLQPGPNMDCSISAGQKDDQG